VKSTLKPLFFPSDSEVTQTSFGYVVRHPNGIEFDLRIGYIEDRNEYEIKELRIPILDTGHVMLTQKPKKSIW
jgi:hypothetical protein